jgi:hypothetical protein
MNPTIESRLNLPPLPRGMYWRGDGSKADGIGLSNDYMERLRLANLVRLTEPGSRMHERAKERLAEIESIGLP